MTCLLSEKAWGEKANWTFLAFFVVGQNPDMNHILADQLCLVKKIYTKNCVD